MRRVLHLQQAHGGRAVRAGWTAAVHVCCHRLVPAISAEVRRRGGTGELVLRLAASALPHCHRR
ncbi:hypothetical protein GCM10023222_21500 [Saccharopolyspora cebuensis]